MSRLFQSMAVVLTAMLLAACTPIRATPPVAAEQPLPVPPQAQEQEQELPIIDAHVHYSQDAWSRFTPTEIISKMAAVDVIHALVSSSPDEGTQRLYAEDPQRIIPFLRPYHEQVTSSNWTTIPAVVPYLEERLTTPIYRGIGEFHLHTAQIESPVFQATVRLALEQDLYLHIHGDAATIRAVFDFEPAAKILWAHAGLSEPPEVVAQLLGDYANLWTDISIREGQIAPNGQLAPAWRDLFLQHPDRILIGSDTWIPPRWEGYERIIELDRTWLNQLPPAIARQIAYENAVRLFLDRRD